VKGESPRVTAWRNGSAVPNADAEEDAPVWRQTMKSQWGGNKGDYGKKKRWLIPVWVAVRDHDGWGFGLNEDEGTFG